MFRIFSGVQHTFVANYQPASDVLIHVAPSSTLRFLADRTIGRGIGTVCRLSSVICRLSSVTFCIVAKRCVLAKKCLKE